MEEIRRIFRETVKKLREFADQHRLLDYWQDVRRFAQWAKPYTLKAKSILLGEWAALRGELGVLAEPKSWTYGLWASAALSVAIAIRYVFIVRKLEGLSTSYQLLAIKLVVVALSVPMAIATQHLFERGSKSVSIRVIGVPVSMLVFLFCTMWIDKLSGANALEHREEIVQRCITSPDGRCRGLVLANRQEVERLPEEQRFQISTYKFEGQVVRRLFEFLTEKNKEYVKDSYRSVLIAHEKKDFQQMLIMTRNILSLVDDYNDTKSYEAIAKRGLQVVEEEKARRENEERQKKVREEVARLEDTGRALFPNAITHPDQRPALDGLIAEIYVKDPNNRTAAEWKRQIKELADKETRVRNQAAVATLLKQADKLHKKAVLRPELRPEFDRVISEIQEKDPNNYRAQQWKGEMQFMEQVERKYDEDQREREAQRGLAELEIRGQKLVNRARTDADARAELYQVMKDITSRDPANTYPMEWRRRLH